MNNNQLTPTQTNILDQVCSFTQKSKEQAIIVLQENNWDSQLAIDFLLSAGDYIPVSKHYLSTNQQSQSSFINQYQERSHYQIQNLDIPLQIQQANQISGLNKEQSNQSEIRKNQQSQQKSINNDVLEIEKQLKLIHNLEQETNQIIEEKNEMFKKSLKQIQVDNQNRIYQLPVGLVNIGKKSYFNCILQILAQNPAFLERILSIKTEQQTVVQQEKHILFIKELQIILRQLIFTKKRFLNHQNFIQNAIELIETQTNTKISDEHLQSSSLFQIFIKTLDVILGKYGYDENENKKLQDLILSAQFQFIQQNVSINYEINLNIEREDRFIYLSLLKIVFKDQFNKFDLLPKTFGLNLKSMNDNQQNYKKEQMYDYWFPSRMNLEFLVNDGLFLQLRSSLLSFVQDEKIKNINEKLKLFNSLIIVEQSYQQGKISEINIIEQMKLLRKNIQEEIDKYFLENNGIVNGEQNNNSYLYYIHAIIIEISQNNQKHFYVYIYNFHLNQWYRFNDTDIREESDEIVKKDALKNGCFLVYVSQNQMESIKHNQQQQIEISAILNEDQGNINWQALETKQLIKPQISKEMKIEIQRENDHFQKQINEQ
ncbi:unnamed protein product [Paramecium sonneborni]|uniref:USP domain-containing protein n=1 Tax=Paramecium sonneborni TaxID=65129 RepID=A0A8S1QUS5_9CILI|nr:unnamed protein product [Paramecium sonneborni]